METRIILSSGKFLANIQKTNFFNFLEKIYKLITQNQGMECFNFMASPVNQPSLIRYKEKWGGVTRQLRVYEIPLRRLNSLLFKNASKINNIINNLL